MPMLLLLLLAKNFLAISNSNVEKRAVAAGRADGENTLLDSLANCVPRPLDRPQLYGGGGESRECEGYVRCGDHRAIGRLGCRMQDTGHFWAGTAGIACFSAHTQMHGNMQQPGRSRGRGRGTGQRDRGICNDADNDLKFIKNSKICVAKNMQLAGMGGEERREARHLPAQKRMCHNRNIPRFCPTVAAAAAAVAFVRPRTQFKVKFPLCCS